MKQWYVLYVFLYFYAIIHTLTFNLMIQNGHKFVLDMTARMMVILHKYETDNLKNMDL